MSSTLAERRAFWAQQVDAWSRSGLSLTAYARQQGLASSSLCRWQRALTSQDSMPAMIPVRVMPAAAPIVLVRGNWRLSLPASTSPVWLAELLQGLS